jgi:hypothetical protein
MQTSTSAHDISIYSVKTTTHMKHDDKKIVIVLRNKVDTREHDDKNIYISDCVETQWTVGNRNYLHFPLHR